MPTYVLEHLSVCGYCVYQTSGEIFWDNVYFAIRVIK